MSFRFGIDDDWERMHMLTQPFNWMLVHIVESIQISYRWRQMIVTRTIIGFIL